MKKVELLSPAGSIESMKAAINAGADAIYMGGNRFSARAYANNPDDSKLQEAVEYLHALNKKIYITVNTLVKQNELSQIEEYLNFLADISVDAIIVQDPGVMYLANNNDYPFEIHASTQMTLLTHEAVNSLPEKITRVVPARELSLSEIKLLKEKTNKEIEVFIHGALCFSYSGQCLFSSTVGGRSGNRGRCAQPCRKCYNDRYMLSMKDLCTIDDLPRLIESGIDSFKIEGRMKSPIYTAGVTDIYRRFIDLYYEKGEKYYYSQDFIHPEYKQDVRKMLAELYNRGGFTKGYFDLKNGPSMIAETRPNHYGLEVGKVEKVNGRFATIKLFEDTSSQDVLEIRKNFLSKNGNTFNARIKSMNDNTSDARIKSMNDNSFEFTIGKENASLDKITINCGKYKPIVNSKVFRTKNNKLNDYYEKNVVSNPKRLPISAVMKAKIGEPMVLYATLDDKIISVTGDEVEGSKNQPTSVERIKEQLYKKTDSCYYILDCKIESDENIFIPIGSINSLRRELLSKYEKEVIASHNKLFKGSDDYNKTLISKERNSSLPCEPYISCKVINLEQYSALNNNNIVNEIILDYAFFNENEIISILNNKEDNKKLILALPHICKQSTFDYLLANKEIITNKHIDGYLARTHEELVLLADKFGISKDRIRLDYTMHNLNELSKSYYKERGYDLFTISTELTLNEINLLRNENSQFLIYGRIPLMITAQCMKKNTIGCDNQKQSIFVSLVDSLNHEIKAKNVCKFCYNILYNDAYLSLIEHKKEIKKLGINSLRFEFTDESASEIDKIISAYINLTPVKQIFTEKKFTNGAFLRVVE